MVYHDTAIRTVVERLKLRPMKHIAQQPGVQTVYRFIAYYADGRAYHSASTLIDKSFRTEKHLEIVYSGFFNDRLIKRQIDKQGYQKFIAVLQASNFDKLQYPGSGLLYTPTIWCIEKATASFSHQITLNPHSNQEPFCRIINAIDGYLPEAVREIQQ